MLPSSIFSSILSISFPKIQGWPFATRGPILRFKTIFDMKSFCFTKILQNKNRRSFLPIETTLDICETQSKISQHQIGLTITIQIASFHGKPAAFHRFRNTEWIEVEIALVFQVNESLLRLSKIVCKE